MSTRVQIAQQKPGVAPPQLTAAPAGVMQRKCACGGSVGSGDDCAECKKKKAALQRQALANSEPGSAPPIVHDVLRSPGKPLDAATRAFFEPRFGHDFSKVRVHDNARAAESARAVKALAYTVGSTIVFARDQYAPSSLRGRSLLAHELAHVVQQGGSASRRPTRISQPDEPSEREAARVQTAMEAGGELPSTSPAEGVVYRQAVAPDSQTVAGGGSQGTEIAKPAGQTEDGNTEGGNVEDGGKGGLSGTVPADPEKPAYEEKTQPCGDATPAARGKPIRVSANLPLQVKSRSGVLPDGPGHADGLSGGIDLSQNIVQGKPPGMRPEEFGRTLPFFARDVVYWREPPGSDKIYFNLPVNLRIDWGVQSRGRTDVPNANDAVVTSSTYGNIIKDLTPTAPSWSSRRDTYWSERLTIVHELFHVNDITNKTQELKASAEKWLNAQTIASPVTGEKVKDVVDKAYDQITNGEKAYMSGWEPEERAYGDGRPKYESLVKDIQARATAAGWP